MDLARSPLCIAWKIVDALYKVWQQSGKFYEFYDPQSLSLENLHRKTGTTQAMSKSGDKPVEDFVGWTGLVDNLVIEILFGLEKKNSQWNLSPALPPKQMGWIFGWLNSIRAVANFPECEIPRSNQGKRHARQEQDEF